MSKLAIRRGAIQSITRRTSCITSGPIPSPGSSRSFLLAGMAAAPLRLFRSQASRAPVARLIRIDRRAHAASSGRCRPARSAANACGTHRWRTGFLAPFGRTTTCRARSTVNRALPPSRASSINWSHTARGRRTGRMPFLKQLPWKDVGEIRRDDAAYAEIQQRPRRVLARTAAAEILMRDQDFRLAVGRLVQHEIRPLVARRVKPQRVEQMHAQPGPLDGLEKPRRE